MSPDRPRPPARRRVFPLVALGVTTSLALLLWGLVAWQVGTNGLMSASAQRATGEVTSCGTGVVGGCAVRYVAPSGQVETRDVERPGLVGIAPGDLVSLWLPGDGTVALAGWRPWADAGLLAAFAAAMTSGAVRWLRTVSSEGDRCADHDDVDLRLGEDDAWEFRSRDVG